ncbi:MAG: hypothetical protein QXX12_01045 [Nanopusillaceae archaeon]
MIPELEEALQRATRRYRPWTPEEEAILRRYYRWGMARHIAQYLNRPLASVYWKAAELGLQRSRVAR